MTMNRRTFLRRTLPTLAGVALAPILLSNLASNIVVDDATVLIRYKGKQLHEAGYFYCPYVPVMYTGVKPTVPDGVKVTPIKFNTRYREMALYG